MSLKPKTSIDKQTVVQVSLACFYLNKAVAALTACVATNRQEAETPANKTSETAPNAEPLGNRWMLGGCLSMQDKHRHLVRVMTKSKHNNLYL